LNSVTTMAVMTRFAFALALLALLALPAGAEARSKPRLVALEDRAPTSTSFSDRVLEHAPASAAQSGTTHSYDAGDGTMIPITVSSALGGDTSVAQTYATFLGTLTHGTELAKLRVRIVPASEVAADCGAPGQDVLACYIAGSRRMIIPGDAQQQSGGVTTSFVIAHEYGHHIAAYRSNAPFSALDFGPKRWASYERVCSRTLDGKLFPGDEAGHYAANPGEGWAETYAHLKYPDVRWDYTSLLKPDAASLTAARADVLDPWTSPVTHRFSGDLGSSGATTRRFTFKVALDGALRVKLSGPKGAQFDLRLRSGGATFAHSSAKGSQDTIDLRAACRTTSHAEKVTVQVVRRSGSGSFRLSARYAG
jgi:hypothetical protein